MMFKAERCKAVSKTTGKPCMQPAVKGGEYCRFHANAPVDASGEEAAPMAAEAPAAAMTTTTPSSPPALDDPSNRDKGAQPGNANARKHGGYSLQLQPEEEAIYQEKKEQFTDQLGKVDIFDAQVVHILSLISTKLDVAAVEGAPAQVLIPISNEVLKLLRSLKETRDSRDQDDGQAPKSFADFLEELDGLETARGIPQLEEKERRWLFALEEEVNELRGRLGFPPRDDIEHRKERCGNCRADTDHRCNLHGDAVCLACGHTATPVLPTGETNTPALPTPPNDGSFESADPKEATP